ncbi:glutamate-1-semialdehyde 2,1-aminomutase [Clostridium perfringens]|uniref:Glutamate-1-semialdehyde 2,1-aminomutase n=2 Tax=Clostridium TaxID=1485 RepID=GSA_CLOPS|nr:RecName: Full=Glutamate-1-semialdehyde 2,1-aminomutase; Short=GSA; AltName: Full=Glutamate-1-semialdehyde aminotransferase; Short=GSA-AT [Clostridium perfringens SM101]MDG6879388.1 Glutamate-1-semialdehyde 21-aminomutase [Clostridium perfringens]MDH5060461.1 Glutamate-1-semialdehyde 21-aminomutase [Clostridium perfringens NCTC 8239]ABG87795.1 glutamate-1-semialdehyde-2,1-aminomutase [Clostridium perfringens SM101]MDG6883865.1 Glutamate-1-semialdehyde 21-aminomutase [Clostridium perfringens]
MDRNKEIFEESKKYMPGGVNSPVRSFGSVGINPPVIKSGKGAMIKDENGNEYIDFVLAWGPMILGHCDEDVVEAIKKTSEESIAFGASTKLELDLAKILCETLDNVDMIRMVNSGTEATMSAVKLARGYTKKDKIIKFAGCYHGHFDGFLIEAGSGVLTEGIPGCLGVPEESIKNTLIGIYNDEKQVEELFEKYGNDIAGIIIEPVAGNMGVVKCDPKFMRKLRELCDKYEALLIFDEVMCGFRVAYKGAQTLFDVKPDLVTYAKIMGGGLPCGAYGGRREIMENLSPLGGVYQAGTMSGNPIVMSAGLATVKKLYENPSYYDHIEKIGSKLEKGIIEIAKKKGLGLVVNRQGGMMTLFFTDLKEVKCYDDVKTCDGERFKRYFLHMLNKGFNIPPSQFEAMFLSVKHTEEHIDKFLEAFESFEG